MMYSDLANLQRIEQELRDSQQRLTQIRIEAAEMTQHNIIRRQSGLSHLDNLPPVATYERYFQMQMDSFRDAVKRYNDVAILDFSRVFRSDLLPETMNYAGSIGAEYTSIYNYRGLQFINNNQHFLLNFQNIINNTFDNNIHEGNDKNQFMSKNQKILDVLQESYTPHLKKVGYYKPKQPNELTCPLSGQIFDHPVTPEQDESGQQNFEKSQINKWLDNNRTNPLTGLLLDKNNLKENKIKKQEVTDIPHQ